MVIVNFIRDKEVGLFARAKRLAKKDLVGHVELLSKTVKRVSETEVFDKSE
jgi:hypothetical protein